MSEAEAKNSQEKSLSPFVMRVGTHPIAYSTMAILAIGTAVFFLAIVPLARMLQPGGVASVSDAIARSEAAKSKLDSQKKIVGAIAGISEEQRNLIAYALPEEADTPGLAVQLNSLVAQSGLRLTGIDMTVASSDSSSDSSAPQSAGALNIVISVDGISYEKLKILLANIESSLRILDVRTLNFAPSSAAVTLEMRTYYMKGA